MQESLTERTKRLFQFLQQYTKLKFKPQYTSDSYQLIWFHDVPEVAGVKRVSHAQIAEKSEIRPEMWLSVQKRQPLPAPALPPEIEPYVLGDVQDHQSELQLNISDTTFSEDQQLALKRIWKQYKGEWQDWASQTKDVQTVQELYLELLKMRQQLEAEPEKYELRLGFGYLVWQTPSGAEVRRHLIVAKAAIEFDAQQGILKVVPNSNGAEMQLEQDMLTPDEQPADIQTMEVVKKLLKDNSEDVWDPNIVPPLLRTWSNALDARAQATNTPNPHTRYVAELKPSMQATVQPVVSLAPALFLRKRSVRGLSESYQNILRQFEHTDQRTDQAQLLPEALLPFLGQKNVQDVQNAGQSGAGQSEEIFFPLPANEQQQQIVRQLRRQQGVVIQGPPGTGKSHTIVNLVAHLLATDQRVLVTSHTARALKVLREKFPSELAALCVTHLRGEEGVKAILERSVREITERVNHRDETQELQEQQELSQSLERDRQEEIRLLEHLKSIREGETHTVSYGPYQGTAQRIGERLREDNERHGFQWLADILQSSPTNQLGQLDHGAFGGSNAQATPTNQINQANQTNLASDFTAPDLGTADFAVDELVETNVTTRELEKATACPLSNKQMLGWLAHVRACHASGQHQQFEQQIWPEQAKLCTPAEFGEFHQKEREAEQQSQGTMLLAEQAEQHSEYPAMVRLTAKNGQVLLNSLEQFRVRRDTLEQHPSSWLNQAAHDLLCDKTSVWKDVKERSDSLLPELEARADWLEQAQVSGLGGRDLDVVATDVSVMLQHLKGGGRWSGFLGLQSAEVKARNYLREVRIHGKVAEEQDALFELQQYLRLKKKLKQLEDTWRSADTNALDNKTVASVKVRIGHWAEQIKIFEHLNPLRQVWQEAQALLQQNNLAAPQWWDLQSVQTYMQALRVATAVKTIEEQRQNLDVLLPPLRSIVSSGKAHPVTQRLISVIEQRQPAEYTAAYEELTQLHELKDNYEQGSTWQNHLQERVPSVVDEIVATAEEAHWEQRLSRFEEAWHWWQTDQKLAEQADSDIEMRHRYRLGIVRERIRKTLGKLAASYAWRNTLSRLQHEEMQGLVGWQEATHRRAARESLKSVHNAFPAWIMPLHLVAETFEMQAGMFDVVIVDEASQAGPEAILLSFLAKKLVVVGDDKQIEPESVGIQTDRVEALAQQHLHDFDASWVIASQKASLFSFAKYSYPPMISLREHFRCMPEIIRFCSDLSYADQPLIPLRQFGADRLKPLMVQRVQDGYTDKNNVNLPEVQAIVEQIKACIASPRYQGKTFGVISLVGDKQAEAIATALRAEISDVEWVKRRIVCGNAYSFQGDERDVIFLSMVDAVSDVQTKRARDNSTFQPRYNVAVSRARDQLWVFHSPDVNDFKSDDLRGSLVRHVQNPAQLQARPLEQEAFQSLLTEAQKPLRREREAPSPFDSWFEVDVYLCLVERGYRVMPQFELAGYRIDMVVEGLKGRLAVECDGDYWHGPERYAADMQRQQILERAGMPFWRVRGSTFFRDPETALEDLWRTLDERGVYPEGDPRNNEFEESELPAVSATPNISSTPSTPNTPDTQGIKLDTYQSWGERQLPDPYVQYPHQLDVEQVLQGLKDIVEAEGPMLCKVVYQRYAKAAAVPYGKRLQRVLDQVFYKGTKRGLFVLSNELGKAERLHQVVRLKDMPEVRLREAGPRDLSDIPPSEIATLMQKILEQRPYLWDKVKGTASSAAENNAVDSRDASEELDQNVTDLFRHCLDVYGAQQLTMKRREHLQRALERLDL